MPNRGARALPQVFGELRPSQIITTFGPGSVVDLQNVSVILAGTEFWATTREQEIDEPRLRSMLRVNRFYRPPVASDGGAAEYLRSYSRDTSDVRVAAESELMTAQISFTWTVESFDVKANTNKKSHVVVLSSFLRDLCSPARRVTSMTSRGTTMSTRGRAGLSANQNC